MSEGGKTKRLRTFSRRKVFDIGAVIEKAVIEHRVVLHPNKKMQKYLGTTE